MAAERDTNEKRETTGLISDIAERGAPVRYSNVAVKDAFLAERVLAVFDQNRDGWVTRVEFLRGIPRLLFGRCATSCASPFACTTSTATAGSNAPKSRA